MEEARERKTHIIAVGNQKGGASKTTTTVHLAAALGEMGRKCLVFDLDMNRGATRHLGIDSDGLLGTFEVLVGEERAEDVIVDDGDPEFSLPPNVHIIPARRTLEKIDQALSAKNKFMITQDVLLEPLQSLMGRYDYIFLDTAPNATTPTIAAYKAADWFILAAFPDPFAIQGLSDALIDIQGAQRHGNPKLKLLGVVLAGVDKRTRLATTLTEYVEQLFNVPGSVNSAKFASEVSRSTVIPQAQKLGKTVLQTDPTHKVAEQYREIARELEARLRAESRTGTTAEPAPGPPAADVAEPAPQALEVANG